MPSGQYDYRPTPQYVEVSIDIRRLFQSVVIGCSDAIIGLSIEVSDKSAECTPSASNVSAGKVEGELMELNDGKSGKPSSLWYSSGGGGGTGVMILLVI